MTGVRINPHQNSTPRVQTYIVQGGAEFSYQMAASEMKVLINCLAIKALAGFVMS